MQRANTKSVKRIVIIFAILILVSSATVLFINYFKGDKIKQLLVTELNKHLNVKVSVGDADISFLKTFPYASLVLSNTAMQPPANFKEAPGLLHAETIFLKFNIFNLISGKYIVHSIKIDNASLTIYEDGNGRSNFDIWKKTTGSSGSVNFDIQKLTLTSSKVYYRNVKRQDDFAITVNNMSMRGNFQQEQFLLKVNGDCFTDRMLIAGKSIAPPRNAIIDSEVDINTRLELLDFKQSLLNYADIPIDFSGTLSYGSKPTIDFQMNLPNTDITNFLGVLPESVVTNLDDYSPTGTIGGRGSVKGAANDMSALTVSVSFALENSTISYNKNKISAHGINATGSFFYAGKKNSELLNLSSFNGKLRTGKFKGSAIIRAFNDPAVKLDLSIQADIKEFESYSQTENFKEPSGIIIADIKYNGHTKSQSRYDQHTTGQATLTDARFNYSGTPVSELNGAIEFKDNKIYFDGLTCRVGKSDLKANGYIENLVNYILNKNQNIYASLNLYSDKLVLEDILALAMTQENGKKATSIFPPHISFNAMLNVNSLTYKKLKTQNLAGIFSLNDDILRGSNISIRAMGGTLTGDGLINGRYGNKAQIITKAKFKGVDITQLFYEFNEFGQTSLISSNLKGKANVSIDFATLLYSDYTINTASIEAVADVEIRDGELNNFQPLQALSRFLDAKELRNVKFATLKNRIEITKKTVLIPRMEIQSSALNLVGYGTHTFGNDIDYHVNMLLSEVVSIKRKKQTELNKYIEDDGYGKPRLFLKMSGPIYDPKVQYDTKAVGRKIADDFKNEKQVFKDVIRKEFGKNTPSTTAPAANQKAIESPEFQIEWDETK